MPGGTASYYAGSVDLSPTHHVGHGQGQQTMPTPRTLADLVHLLDDSDLHRLRDHLIDHAPPVIQPLIPRDAPAVRARLADLARMADGPMAIPPWLASTIGLALRLAHLQARNTSHDAPPASTPAPPGPRNQRIRVRNTARD